jgi:metallophosphoesterase (TIGR03767 family)
MAVVIRTDLGGVAVNGPGEPLLSLVHLTDTHILDAASPARAEWVELEAHDPAFRPLLHMHRPYDTLTTWALQAHVERIRRDPYGPASHRPFDLAVSTGDNIDNGQRNELDAYLALVSGGVASFDASGCAQDASSCAFDGVWPYWCPDETVADAWRERGFPALPDFIERVSASVQSTGFGIPWTSVPGNHDLMRQGTALTNPAIEAIAVGAKKSLTRPADFNATNPIDLYLDEPEAFSRGTSYPIAANLDRRGIDRKEWLAAHVARGAVGYTDAHVQHGNCDTVIDTEHVRLVLLDTNHPAGDYQGSIGLRQLAWLDARLTEVDNEPGRIAILISHHGADTLVNDRGHDPDRGLADDMGRVVHRHACVVAWLVGHRHINRIEPRPGDGGGFWEITTSSVIDWPSQTRALEVLRHRDGSIEIASTLIDHADAADGLATLHRDLAHRFRTPNVAARMSGRDLDGDVRLVLPPR